MKLLNNAPSLPLHDAVYRLYPYKSFLPKEGISSVEDTLQNFQLNQNPQVLSKITTDKPPQNGFVDLMIGKKAHQIQVPVGNRFESPKSEKYVKIAYHESLLAELALSHAVHDFCIIGMYEI